MTEAPSEQRQARFEIDDPPLARRLAVVPTVIKDARREKELATSNRGDTYAKVPQRRRRGLYSCDWPHGVELYLACPAAWGLRVPSPAWAEGTPVRVSAARHKLSDSSKLVVHAKDGKDAT